MAVTVSWFANAIKALVNKEIDWNDGNVKAMLCTSSYTPNLLTHDYKDDVTNEVAGTGYSAGGVVLPSPTVSLTAANSLTAWAANTAYPVGDIRRPTTGNGHAYRCIVAGTSHAATEPTWPTVAGQTVADGTVTWAECGAAVLTLDAGDVSWLNSTLTARYALIYYNTGVNSTSPLLLLINFGEDKSSDAGEFKIQFDSRGIARLPI